MTLDRNKRRRAWSKKANELQHRLTAEDEQVDKLERDAARYRWLHDPDNRDGLEPEDFLVVRIAEGEDIVWLEQMDKAIDTSALNEK